MANGSGGKEVSPWLTVLVGKGVSPWLTVLVDRELVSPWILTRFGLNQQTRKLIIQCIPLERRHTKTKTKTSVAYAHSHLACD